MPQSIHSTNSILDEIFQLLPARFGALAYQTKALQRAGKIQTSDPLLHLVLLYCGLDYSLVQTAAILTALFEKISDTAVFERLSRCQAWLKALLQSLVQEALAEQRKNTVQAN